MKRRRARRELRAAPRHTWPLCFMPEHDPVTCEACGCEMRRTGKIFPHVLFRPFGALRWARKRPDCVQMALFAGA